ncbi:hypothetical protein, partial [Paracoccus sp. PAMC 22219]|uniref:hypothetical protein n=1 Tax=Paracoccus sp. PAMC 22219 TaxID=1569209 RepID=UPI001E4F372D
FKDTGRATEQRVGRENDSLDRFLILPTLLIYHRRMHAEPARKIRHGLLAFQRLNCHLHLELGRVRPSFRHRRSPS